MQKNRYLKSIVDNSVIVYNEIVSIMDIVSKNVISSVQANVTSNVSMNSDNKKIRYKMNCYNLQMFMLVVILLFLITIICYHYTKHWSKLKKYCSVDNIKWRIMNYKELVLKILPYYFDDIIEIEDFDIDVTLLDEKLYEKNLINGILYKTLIRVKPSGLSKSYSSARNVLDIKNLTNCHT